jgi:hypothetical protein
MRVENSSKYKDSGRCRNEISTALLLFYDDLGELDSISPVSDDWMDPCRKKEMKPISDDWV